MQSNKVFTKSEDVECRNSITPFGILCKAYNLGIYYTIGLKKKNVAGYLFMTGCQMDF